MKNYKWRKKMEELGLKAESTSTIKFGEKSDYRMTNMPEEEGRFILPAGLENWCNVFFAFRLTATGGRTKGLRSPTKVSLRKYEHVPQKGWQRRQSFNVNNRKEAQAIIGFLKARMEV